MSELQLNAKKTALLIPVRSDAGFQLQVGARNMVSSFRCCSHDARTRSPSSE
jgi:hypothetical protein